MSALAEILPTYQLFVRGEDLVDAAANESQGKEISDAAIRKYLYLDLDGKKIPRGGRGRWIHFPDSGVMRVI